MGHYRCFKVFIHSTGTVRIDDTNIWFPSGSLNLPIPSKDEFLHSALYDLRTTLQSSVKKYILPPEGTTSRNILLGLNDIFNNRDVRNPYTKPRTPTNITRVKVKSKDPIIVPREGLHSNDTTRVPMVQPPVDTPSPQQTLRRSEFIWNLYKPIVSHNSNATIHLSALEKKSYLTWLISTPFLTKLQETY